MDAVDLTQPLNEDWEISSTPQSCLASLQLVKQANYPETLVFQLHEGENVIGRHEDCDVRIDNKVLSKRHAAIEVVGSDCLIYDLGSSNKTRKGRRILRPHVRYNLEDGDALSFGNVSMIFKKSINKVDNESESESENEVACVRKVKRVTFNAESDSSDFYDAPTQKCVIAPRTSKELHDIPGHHNSNDNDSVTEPTFDNPQADTLCFAETQRYELAPSPFKGDRKSDSLPPISNSARCRSSQEASVSSRHKNATLQSLQNKEKSCEVSLNSSPIPKIDKNASAQNKGDRESSTAVDATLNPAGSQTKGPPHNASTGEYDKTGEKVHRSIGVSDTFPKESHHGNSDNSASPASKKKLYEKSLKLSPVAKLRDGKESSTDTDVTPTVTGLQTKHPLNDGSSDESEKTGDEACINVVSDTAPTQPYFGNSRIISSSSDDANPCEKSSPVSKAGETTSAQRTATDDGRNSTAVASVAAKSQTKVPPHNVSTDEKVCRSIGVSDTFPANSHHGNSNNSASPASKKTFCGKSLKLSPVAKLRKDDTQSYTDTDVTPTATGPQTKHPLNDGSSDETDKTGHEVCINVVSETAPTHPYLGNSGIISSSSDDENPSEKCSPVSKAGETALAQKTASTDGRRNGTAVASFAAKSQIKQSSQSISDKTDQSSCITITQPHLRNSRIISSSDDEGEETDKYDDTVIAKVSRSSLSDKIYESSTDEGESFLATQKYNPNKGNTVCQNDKQNTIVKSSFLSSQNKQSSVSRSKQPCLQKSVPSTDDLPETSTDEDNLLANAATQPYIPRKIASSDEDTTDAEPTCEDIQEANKSIPERSTEDGNKCDDTVTSKVSKSAVSDKIYESSTDEGESLLATQKYNPDKDNTVCQNDKQNTIVKSLSLSSQNKQNSVAPSKQPSVQKSVPSTDDLLETSTDEDTLLANAATQPYIPRKIASSDEGAIDVEATCKDIQETDKSLPKRSTEDVNKCDDTVIAKESRSSFSDKIYASSTDEGESLLATQKYNPNKDKTVCQNDKRNAVVKSSVLSSQNKQSSVARSKQPSLQNSVPSTDDLPELLKHEEEDLGDTRIFVPDSEGLLDSSHNESIESSGGTQSISYVQDSMLNESFYDYSEEQPQKVLAPETQPCVGEECVAETQETVHVPETLGVFSEMATVSKGETNVKCSPNKHSLVLSRESSQDNSRIKEVVKGDSANITTKPPEVAKPGTSESCDINSDSNHFGKSSEIDEVKFQSLSEDGAVSEDNHVGPKKLSGKFCQKRLRNQRKSSDDQKTNITLTPLRLNKVFLEQQVEFQEEVLMQSSNEETSSASLVGKKKNQKKGKAKRKQDESVNSNVIRTEVSASSNLENNVASLIKPGPPNLKEKTNVLHETRSRDVAEPLTCEPPSKRFKRLRKISSCPTEVVAVESKNNASSTEGSKESNLPCVTMAEKHFAESDGSSPPPKRSRKSEVFAITKPSKPSIVASSVTKEQVLVTMTEKHSVESDGRSPPPKRSRKSTTFSITEPSESSSVASTVTKEQVHENILFEVCKESNKSQEKVVQHPDDTNDDAKLLAGTCSSTKNIPKWSLRQKRDILGKINQSTKEQSDCFSSNQPAYIDDHTMPVSQSARSRNSQVPRLIEQAEVLESDLQNKMKSQDNVPPELETTSPSPMEMTESTDQKKLSGKGRGCKKSVPVKNTGAITHPEENTEKQSSGISGAMTTDSDHSLSLNSLKSGKLSISNILMETNSGTSDSSKQNGKNSSRSRSKGKSGRQQAIPEESFSAANNPSEDRNKLAICTPSISSAKGGELTKSEITAASSLNMAVRSQDNVAAKIEARTISEKEMEVASGQNRSSRKGRGHKKSLKIILASPPPEENTGQHSVMRTNTPSVDLDHCVSLENSEKSEFTARASASIETVNFPETTESSKRSGRLRSSSRSKVKAEKKQEKIKNVEQPEQPSLEVEATSVAARELRDLPSGSTVQKLNILSVNPDPPGLLEHSEKSKLTARPNLSVEILNFPETGETSMKSVKLRISSRPKGKNKDKVKAKDVDQPEQPSLSVKASSVAEGELGNLTSELTVQLDVPRIAISSADIEAVTTDRPKSRRGSKSKQLSSSGLSQQQPEAVVNIPDEVTERSEGTKLDANIVSETKTAPKRGRGRKKQTPVENAPPSSKDGSAPEQSSSDQTLMSSVPDAAARSNSVDSLPAKANKMPSPPADAEDDAFARSNIQSKKSKRSPSSGTGKRQVSASPQPSTVINILEGEVNRESDGEIAVTDEVFRTKETPKQGRVKKTQFSPQDSLALSKDENVLEKSMTSVPSTSAVANNQTMSKTPTKFVNLSADGSPSKNDSGTSCSERKKQGKSEVKPKICFTGIDSNKYERMVTKLKGMIVDDASTCTHLVSDKFRRTAKMLCCIARGIPIVSDEWIKKSASNNNILDATQFLIKDKEAEKRHVFNLRSTLEKSLESPLLSGWSVHATSNVVPPPSNIKDIVHCAGGKYLPKKPSKFAENLVVISCDEDMSQVKSLQKHGIPIVTNEFLLTGLLQYKADIAAHQIA